MDVVTHHQSGSTRIKPLVAAVAASVTIAVLIGLGAFTGMPNARAPMPRDDGPLARGEVKPAQPSTCALCGTIESVRTVEVYDEPSAGTGVADPKAETAGAGPGGAIANGAMSVLDSLSGFVPGSAAENEKNLRKRFVWRVTLRMDDGSFRAISLSRPPAFAVGEKVRVVEGHLVRA